MLIAMTRHLQVGAEKAAQKAPELFTLVILVVSFLWFADRSQKMAADGFRNQTDTFSGIVKDLKATEIQFRERMLDTVSKLSDRLDENSAALRGVQAVLADIARERK